MKTKRDRKGAADKKPYVGPRLTILPPKSDDAKRLADELASGLPVKGRAMAVGRKAKS